MNGTHIKIGHGGAHSPAWISNGSHPAAVLAVLRKAHSRVWYILQRLVHAHDPGSGTRAGVTTVCNTLNMYVRLRYTVAFEKKATYPVSRHAALPTGRGLADSAHRQDALRSACAGARARPAVLRSH